MSRVIDFEEYKERAKSRRQHTIVYANKLPVIDDSDMVLNSLFITKAAADDEPIVVIHQVDFGEDPPLEHTTTFSQEELPTLVEALIEINQCISKEEDH